ncbi:MAG TPA: UTP--glucose-1-phosphate uridylyltransferase [Candidatus Bathyarchaeia archaeon]|nr:UTP--glucose-1-phosphate uridylyltransferase [Candidatus Bathyarchaeia archaeon]
MQFAEARALLDQYGQEHLLEFYPSLEPSRQRALRRRIEAIDFHLMTRLIDQWVLHEPAPEKFSRIEPIPLIPKAAANPRAAEAVAAGEDALRRGRVGLFLVAGGQGTRLGFPGPKGAYPIGPVSSKSLFEFHAEKIHNLRARYGCPLPWYIMTSESNHDETREFFTQNSHFGLDPANIMFFNQRMVPCVDMQGKFMLDATDSLACNPNGHGGCIPALVENGALDDARNRGIDMFSYFQVDNWAVQVADPYFIGLHVLHAAEMSSKNHRKDHPRESVGVHCLCDGVYHVIEYTELDIYPQLLETTPDGKPIHSAGNSAIHILSADFIQRVYNDYEHFPWHRAHKKIPCLDHNGNLVEPDAPNGYKFETFVFDALRFIRHKPVAVEIDRPGEYTPIKEYDGDNSVLAAWQCMNEYWADWLEAAGCNVARDANGKVAIKLEISPQFALTKDEFLQRAHARDAGKSWPTQHDLAIGPNGEIILGCGEH